ncbi:MAG: PA14 domain-containing protein [Chitinophagaceae bacterium]
MPSLHSLTPVATGSVENITLSNRTQNDRFAYLWEGNINIPVSGTYTFRTSSDDGSQFWIGGLPNALVVNDGLHGTQDRDGTITLNAGVYPVAILYYEQDGGEVMNFSWKTPQTGGSFQTVPNNAFVNAPILPNPTEPGLKFRYFTYSGTWYHMPNLHALTPAASGIVANVNLNNRTQNDRFAYIWDGYINIPVTGSYTFRTTSDDGSQLWIGSLPAPLINNDGLHAPVDKEGTLTLTAGTYLIAFLYYEQDGGETMNISWKTPQTGGNFVTIPNSAFTTRSASVSSSIDSNIQVYNLAKPHDIVIQANTASVSMGKMVPEEVKQSGMAIFPNPAIDHVNVRLIHAAKGAIQVKVFNALGVAVKTMKYTKDNNYWQQQLPVSDLKAGYYIIEVTGRSLTYKTSFIKK